jgi:hypothetical protein
MGAALLLFNISRSLRLIELKVTQMASRPLAENSRSKPTLPARLSNESLTPRRCRPRLTSSSLPPPAAVIDFNYPLTSQQITAYKRLGNSG